MKKKIFFLQGLYYLLVPCAFMVFFYGTSLLIPNKAGLGTVMAATYGVLFVGTPILTAVLMRCSLLRWYMDPFAAGEIPLCLYLMMLLNQVKRSGSFAEGFSALNHSLALEGFLFLAGLFLFGLIASISPSRKAGQNIMYRFMQEP